MAIYFYLYLRKHKYFIDFIFYEISLKKKQLIVYNQIIKQFFMSIHKIKIPG